MITVTKMGAGTLTFGAAGAQDVSCQVIAFTVECDEQVKQDDSVPTLCGETYTPDPDVSYDWKVSGNLLQDTTAAGFISWTWAHKGETHPFVFIPSSAAGRKVTGTCRIAPLAVGGKVKETPTSDIQYAVIGTPVLAAV